MMNRTARFSNSDFHALSVILQAVISASTALTRGNCQLLNAR